MSDREKNGEVERFLALAMIDELVNIGEFKKDAERGTDVLKAAYLFGAHSVLETVAGGLVNGEPAETMFEKLKKTRDEMFLKMDIADMENGAV